jgi:hypothetical protein
MPVAGPSTPRRTVPRTRRRRVPRARLDDLDEQYASPLSVPTPTPTPTPFAAVVARDLSPSGATATDAVPTYLDPMFLPQRPRPLSPGIIAVLVLCGTLACALFATTIYCCHRTRSLRAKMTPRAGTQRSVLADGQCPSYTCVCFQKLTWSEIQNSAHGYQKSKLAPGEEVVVEGQPEAVRGKNVPADLHRLSCQGCCTPPPGRPRSS